MLKLFTHTDLDGIGCAVLAKQYFGDCIDITYCNYNTVDMDVSKFLDEHYFQQGELCFITDISVSEKVAENINNSRAKDFVVLLDHHPTALSFNSYDWANVEIYKDEKSGIKTSGTELFLNWLRKNSFNLFTPSTTLNVDNFVDLVRNWDTWRWAEMGKAGLDSKNLNDLFQILGREDFIAWCIETMHKTTISPFTTLSEKETAMLDMLRKEQEEYIKKKNQTMLYASLKGYFCGFVYADRFISEVGNTLCKLNPELDLVVVIDISSKAVSYRTIKEDIDLGLLAKEFGGGGHPKAAGSQIAKGLPLKVVEKIFDINA